MTALLAGITSHTTALAGGQCQRGIGNATLAGQYLRDLWADLPPEYADDIQQCLDDAAEVARLFRRIAKRLGTLPSAVVTKGASGRDAA